MTRFECEVVTPKDQRSRHLVASDDAAGGACSGTLEGMKEQRAVVVSGGGLQKSIQQQGH